MATAEPPLLSQSPRAGCPDDARRMVGSGDVLLALAVLALGLVLWWQRDFFHDDAYVTLRYARRLLAGQGLTWNDHERVEGFSSPLWLGQIALLHGLSLPLPWAARMLGLGYAIAIVGLWRRMRAAPAGLLVLVTIPGFALWTWGGLETLASVLFTLLPAALLLRPSTPPSEAPGGILLGLCLAALALVRPEGVACAALFLVAAPTGPSRPRLRMSAAILALAFLAYQAFRMAYFGDWLANAARAKTLGLPWGTRLEGAAVYVAKTAPQWLGTVVLATWMLAWSPGRARVRWLLLPTLPPLLAVVAGGGDHMVGARLMLAPVALLVFVASLAPPPSRPWLTPATAVLALACACLQSQLTLRYRATPDLAAAMGEIVGREIEARLPPGALVASATAGSIPFFAPSLNFIDTLGLNDRHIARSAPATAALAAALDRDESWTEVPGHMRGDGLFVLSRSPDVVILGGANGSLLPSFLGDYQIVLGSAFRQAYAPWRLLAAVPAASRKWLADDLDAESSKLPITLYVRRDSRARNAIAKAGSPLPPPWTAGK
jgi:arabinofuranosyltransferase